MSVCHPSRAHPWQCRHIWRVMLNSNHTFVNLLLLSISASCMTDQSMLSQMLLHGQHFMSPSCPCSHAASDAMCRAIQHLCEAPCSAVISWYTQLCLLVCTGSWQSFRTSTPEAGLTQKAAAPVGSLTVPNDAKSPQGLPCPWAGQHVGRSTKCPATRKSYKACCGKTYGSS